MAAAKWLLGAQHAPSPRRGEPHLGLACFALSSAYVVAAAARGVNSKPRAAAFCGGEGTASATRLAIGGRRDPWPGRPRASRTQA
jgi:hypothetical protein